MAENLLKKLKVKYPHINYTVVLAYITDSHNLDYGDTVFPDELAATPPKFAIDRRNKWMIKKCDFLVCYVRHNFSNSHKFKEYAKKQNKTIFNLYLLSNLTDC